jgi:hypothetical protein
LERFRKENQLAELPLANLIVGEGLADVAFLDALLEQRGLRAYCHLGFPDGLHKGKDGFGDYLVGLRTKLERQNSGTQRILVVTDSDDDPNLSFRNVCQHIRNANVLLEAPRHYSVPNAIRELSAGAAPQIAVGIMPWDNEAGCLETLLLTAADDGSHPLHDCFEAYWQCVRFDANRKNVQSKKKLTTIIAATNDKNPSCSLGMIWSNEQRAGNPMRIDHQAFVRWGAFLDEFVIH